MKKENQIAAVKNTLAIRKVENLLSITEKLLKKEFSHCIYINHERAQIARLINNNVQILEIDASRNIPLAVGFNKKGYCYVGIRALNMWSSKSSSYVDFLRNLGSDYLYHFPNMQKTYTSTELLAVFLKYLCRSKAQTKITDSLVIIPDSFSSRQINELKKAANLAALSNVSLIHESIAIQNYYENNLSDTNDFNLTLSINKTSSTISLVKEKTIIDTKTDNYWGGDNIDYLIVDKLLIPYLRDKFKINTLVKDERKLKNLRNRLRWYAESIKIELSNKRKFEILTDLGALANDDNGEEMEIDLEITEDDLRGVLKDDFQNLINRINEVMDRNKLSLEDISEIFLSGANTSIPQLKNMLAENFIEPKINQENHNAVIIGGTLLLNKINTAGNNVYSA